MLYGSHLVIFFEVSLPDHNYPHSNHSYPPQSPVPGFLCLGFASLCLELLKVWHRINNNNNNNNNLLIYIAQLAYK